MRLARQAYDVPGVGVGEVWLRGAVVVHHQILFHEDARDRRPSRHRAAGTRGAAPVGSRGDSLRREAVSSLEAVSAGGGRTHPPTGGAGSPLRTVAQTASRGCSDLVTDLCRRFHQHLCGRRVAYADVEVDVDGLTPFQRALTAALRAVPWGEVVTYGELAALAGRPGAARAAGAFCAESRVALVVPCHRVVAADGIGGYGSSGIAVKRRLLRLEGVVL